MQYDCWVTEMRCSLTHSLTHSPPLSLSLSLSPCIALTLSLSVSPSLSPAKAGCQMMFEAQLRFSAVKPVNLHTDSLILETLKRQCGAEFQAASEVRCLPALGGKSWRYTKGLNNAFIHRMHSSRL